MRPLTYVQLALRTAMGRNRSALSGGWVERQRKPWPAHRLARGTPPRTVSAGTPSTAADTSTPPSRPLGTLSH